MRNRLIELCENLISSCKSSSCKECSHKNIDYHNCMSVRFAEYLLANGVIVPTLKLDDFVYGCGEKNVHEWQIVRIDVYPDEIVYIDDSDNEIYEDDVGKTVFLTREEAEKILKGGDE